MSTEQIFSEFFEELGGIENLKLVVNLRDVEYSNRICPYDTVDFTVGWEKSVRLTATKHRFYSSGLLVKGEFYYCLYLGAYYWRLRRSDVKNHLSALIRHHTGNEIFPFP